MYACAYVVIGSITHIVGCSFKIHVSIMYAAALDGTTYNMSLEVTSYRPASIDKYIGLSIIK